MNNLLSDLSSFRLAPTVGREIAASTVGFIAILVVVLLVVESPVLSIALSAAYLLYGLVRIALVVRRASSGSAPRAVTRDR